MKNYIISYWLRHPENNYSKFYDSLKKNYPKYIHIMEETWFIKTTEGCTPRRRDALLASLMDLTSGSGDRATPIVLIKNYI